jgi:hypothetical protein
MRKIAIFLLYYLVVTPVGTVWRFVRDPLCRAREPHRDSYWNDLSPTP